MFLCLVLDLCIVVLVEDDEEALFRSDGWYDDMNEFSDATASTSVLLRQHSSSSWNNMKFEREASLLLYLRLLLHFLLLWCDLLMIAMMSKYRRSS